MILVCERACVDAIEHCLMFLSFYCLSSLFIYRTHIESLRLRSLTTTLSLSSPRTRTSPMALPNAQLAWPVNRVRQEFVNFFTARDHTFWAGSPVVPLQDPTLLFINAGMNQYKTLFLGTADPKTEYGQLRRAANAQMCIRAGGKHNDLDDVGNDTYHHTFFEMLGCWSFGDYFKKEIVPWAWELLTTVYKLPADQLYVTYFEGDPALGLEPDLEVKALWEKLLPADHIVPGNAKDNFWEMGDTGPCGPCSEIHFDRIGGRNAASLVNKDDPMVIEVWNLVFIEFERRSATELVPLPKKHVDTGMGLERLTSILQGVTSNYDTDAWTPLFEAIQRVTGVETPYSAVRHETNHDLTVAYRVVADHARCLTTALADGAVPDSVGRGFVLRRIIRRAIRYGVQFLNAKTGFFSELVEAVVESLGPFYERLQVPKTVQRIKALLLEEEQSFEKTWGNGLKHFQKAVADCKKQAPHVISATDAFILHDRYGFPVDLTQLLAQKEGVSVDMKGFQEQMKQNQVSAGRVAAAKAFMDVYDVEKLKEKNVPTTVDQKKYIWEEATSEIVAIFDKKEKTFIQMLMPSAPAKPSKDAQKDDERYAIIVAETNFYSEAGGQVHDTGVLVASQDCVFNVRRVMSVGGYVIHIGNLDSTSTCPLPACAGVELHVDYERRLCIASNHTATHQLNWVLRRVLQEEKPDQFFEVHQKGSLVTESLLRFDFSYPNKLTTEELKRVEKLLNERVTSDLAVSRQEVPLDVAKTIYGCRHMFEETYPNPVAVISVGASVEDILKDPTNTKWGEYAIEFCGGTHLEMLCEAQQAVILSEEALMKGVRRMVIVTRDAARAALEDGSKLEEEVNQQLSVPVSAASVKALSVLGKKVNDSSVPLLYKASLRETIDAAIKEQNAALKVMAAQAKAQAGEAGKAFSASQADAANHFFTVATTEYGADREALQAYADAFLEGRSNAGICVLGVDEADGKGLAIILLASELLKAHPSLSAVQWAKASVGKGGGKPHAAQSGFPAAKWKEVQQKAEKEACVMEAALA